MESFRSRLSRNIWFEVASAGAAARSSAAGTKPRSSASPQVLGNLRVCSDKVSVAEPWLHPFT
jgi:hypothetical protein